MSPATPSASPSDFAPFCDGLRRGELWLPTSPRTNAFLDIGVVADAEGVLEQVVWRRASGKGTVVTFAEYRRAYLPQLEGLTPFLIGVVALEEGPSIVCRLVEEPSREVRCGDAVAADFEDYSSTSLLTFRHQDR